MKLFVLIGYYDSSSECLGVFSTKLLAEEHAINMVVNDELESGNWNVLVSVLDSGKVK